MLDAESSKAFRQIQPARSPRRYANHISGLLVLPQESPGGFLASEMQSAFDPSLESQGRFQHTLSADLSHEYGDIVRRNDFAALWRRAKFLQHPST